MREGGLWVLQPSALAHLTPYIDVLRSYSSVLQSKRKSWVWRVGFFVKRVWQVCCERSTNTSSHAGRGADSDPNRLTGGNISDVARTRRPHCVATCRAGASRVPVATCRGRLAREARLAARDPRAARRRGTARAPDARRCS